MVHVLSAYNEKFLSSHRVNSGIRGSRSQNSTHIATELHKIPVFVGNELYNTGNSYTKLTIGPSQICSVIAETGRDFRHYVETHSVLLLISIMEWQNFCHTVNVVSNGSPSRIRRVRRISLGMTTRPRSSILLTMPVAFIYKLPPFFCFQG